MTLFLFIAAILSSIISGMIGMGGGVTLLAAMTLVLPLNLIIPIHGIVQLGSNLSRTIILRKSVHKTFFLYFAIGTPFGAWLAYKVLSKMTQPDWALALIGLVLLYVVFKPKHLPEIRLSRKGYILLGLVAGGLGCLIGATGPLLAPFYVRTDLSKEEMVSTKSACQITIHLMKLPVFSALAFPYFDHASTIGIMLIAVVIGTKIGTELLRRLSTTVFLNFIRVVMFLISIRLFYKTAQVYF